MAWFLERILGGKKKETKGKAISLPELRRWCEGYILGKEREALEELESKADKILSLKNEAAEIVEELAEYEFPEDIKKRVYKSVLTHKPVYTKGLLEALSGLRTPEKSIEGFRKFYNELTNTLAVVQKIQLNHGRYLIVFFRDELPSLGGVLNKIIDLKGEYEAVLNDLDRSKALIRGLIQKAETIDEQLKTVYNLRGEISAIEKSLAMLDEKYGNLNKELNGFVVSSRYTEFLKAKEALEEKRQRKSEVESRILNLLKSKARLFRKYQKYLESRREKFEFISKYLDDPVGVFSKEEPGCPNLRRIIRGVEQAERDGWVSLDEKEEQAIQIDWQALDKLKMELAEFERVPELDDSMETERKKLEDELNRTRVEKEKLSSALGTAKEEIKALWSSVKKEKGELENELAQIRGEQFSLGLPAA